MADTAHAPPQAPAHDKEKIPRILLRAIAILLVTITALVAYARFTGIPPTAMPPDIPIVKERTLIIYGSMEGKARVLDQHGTLIADLAPDQGGFIAGVWRSMARVRAQHDIAADAPVRLVKFSDGHLGLRDDFTGWRVELVGFGKDNTAAFARLLEDK